MLRPNLHYAELKSSYLFYNIAQKTKAYLAENPDKHVALSLINDLTEDPSFNSLLTDRRIQSLEKYFRKVLPQTVKFNISNGCDGQERCNTATGSSILTILIDK